MQLAGVPIRDDDVRELERLLREGGLFDVASKLDQAITMETRVLALTVVDRESMLWALDEPPTDALAELRGVLLSEHEWRVREGLVERAQGRGGRAERRLEAWPGATPRATSFPRSRGSSPAR